MGVEREQLVLTKEEARAIVWEDTSEYETIQDEIYDTSRWSEMHTITVQRLSDGKYFQDEYSRGLTESQDEQPYDYTDPDFREVFKIEKTIIAYE